ncbi:MAG: c-type cytochrome [Gammaproteobacteria bacterium]|nr:c-type cytochrome [Gammaproteobacteria bacterium]
MKYYSHYIGVCLLMGFAYPAIAGMQENLDTCYSCHGKDGASTDKDIPIIGGYSAIYITDSMKAYSNKERPCEKVEIRSGPHKGDKKDMCEIAKNLSEADTKEIADHLASEPFVRAKQSFDPDKAAAGKKIHNRQCKKCHEDGGSSPDDDAGILAGQHMEYIQEQMEDYVAGKRPMPEKMQPKIEKLDKTDLENLTHYYGSFQ